MIYSLALIHLDVTGKHLIITSIILVNFQIVINEMRLRKVSSQHLELNITFYKLPKH